MTESVLDTIKLMLGLESDYTPFDNEIIPFINAVLVSLSQMNVVTKGTIVTGRSTKWSDLIGNRQDLESIKTYIYLKVKELFDPPTNSSALEALRNVSSELEWRLNTRTDDPDHYV